MKTSKPQNVDGGRPLYQGLSAQGSLKLMTNVFKGDDSQAQKMTSSQIQIPRLPVFDELGNSSPYDDRSATAWQQQQMLKVSDNSALLALGRKDLVDVTMNVKTAHVNTAIANHQAKEENSQTSTKPSMAPVTSSADVMSNDMRGDGVTIERHGIFDEIDEFWVHLHGEVRYGVVPDVICERCGGTHPTETCGGHWLQFWLYEETAPEERKGGWYDHPDLFIPKLWDGRYAEFARPWPDRKVREIPFPPEYYCKSAFKTTIPGLTWHHSAGRYLIAALYQVPTKSKDGEVIDEMGIDPKVMIDSAMSKLRLQGKKKRNHTKQLLKQGRNPRFGRKRALSSKDQPRSHYRHSNESLNNVSSMKQVDGWLTLPFNEHIRNPCLGNGNLLIYPAASFCSDLAKNVVPVEVHQFLDEVKDAFEEQNWAIVDGFDIHSSRTAQSWAKYMLSEVLSVYAMLLIAIPTWEDIHDLNVPYEAPASVQDELWKWTESQPSRWDSYATDIKEQETASRTTAAEDLSRRLDAAAREAEDAAAREAEDEDIAALIELENSNDLIDDLCDRDWRIDDIADDYLLRHRM